MRESPCFGKLGGAPMSDDSNWLKNPTLPRPPAVPYFEPAELDGVPDSDRRFIARTYAREARRERSRRRPEYGRRGWRREQWCERRRNGWRRGQQRGRGCSRRGWRRWVALPRPPWPACLR